MRKLIQKSLQMFGLKLVELEDDERQFPVELSADDKRILKHVIHGRLTMTSRERLYATAMACRHVIDKGIAGDFVECGVWRGGNSMIAADVFSRTSANRATWLFDTFAGMTAPTDADVDLVGAPAQAEFARTQGKGFSSWCLASLEDVQHNFATARIATTSVHFVKGDVLKTLEDASRLPDRIAVLRLDTDWYESTKRELEVLYPRLSPGGILIIDDYGYWVGARKAVDEYFESRPRPFLQYVDQTGRVGVKLS